MNDYCNGIAYATGYIAKENGKQYLVVRNLDPFYPSMIERESKHNVYESKHNVKRDGLSQWAIKAKDINRIPDLAEIKNINDFCRAYIEIHGTIDMTTVKDRRGIRKRKPRLRIYGKEEIISFINDSLPAKNKKIQHICNIVDTDYIGVTCAVYYQSAKEIADILHWIDGFPKNEKIWSKWERTLIPNNSAAEN